MKWTRFAVTPNISLVRFLTDGVPVWVKVRAVNRGVFHFKLYMTYMHVLIDTKIFRY